MFISQHNTHVIPGINFLVFMSDYDSDKQF